MSGPDNLRPGPDDLRPRPDNLTPGPDNLSQRAGKLRKVTDASSTSPPLKPKEHRLSALFLANAEGTLKMETLVRRLSAPAVGL